MNQILLFIGLVIILCLTIKPVGKKLPFPTLLIFIALGMLLVSTARRTSTLATMRSPKPSAARRCCSSCSTAALTPTSTAPSPLPYPQCC